MSTQIDTSFLDDWAKFIKSNVARAGAQAMAQVVYDAAKVNAPALDRDHYFYGTASKSAPKGEKKSKAYLLKPGTLRDAIYQVYSKDNSTDTRAEYHVSWNHKKAPQGFMVEFGHHGKYPAPAHPFLYPAYEHNKGKLVDAAVKAMSLAMKAGVK